MFSIGCDTGLGAGSTLTSSVALYIPLRVTLALATDTLTMVRTGAEQTIVPVTAEVVTLAVVTVHSLIRVVTGVALTLATNTVSSVVTQGGGGVVRPTASLQVATEGKILR